MGRVAVAPSRASVAHCTVYHLTQKVSVPVVARVLLHHVRNDPVQRDLLVATDSGVAEAARSPARARTPGARWHARV